MARCPCCSFSPAPPRMAYTDDIIPRVICEVGRAVADRILTDKGRRNDDDYGRHEHRGHSPHRYNSASSSSHSQDDNSRYGYRSAATSFASPPRPADLAEDTESSAITAKDVGVRAPPSNLGLMAHHNAGGHPIFSATEAAKDDETHGKDAGKQARKPFENSTV
ncbi:hypothetical protein B0H16DRAFT_1845550 [Mycena metata]|uniref:Uncharacterized protein n=1 Tax=Mycena metata TaxID=1033252 RepID=A0AAD7N7M6_9AGAR|nr:hypothetical protein B0H16DRAFT_1845550 [Mycena metata]